MKTYLHFLSTYSRISFVYICEIVAHKVSDKSLNTICMCYAMAIFSVDPIPPAKECCIGMINMRVERNMRKGFEMVESGL